MVLVGTNNTNSNSNVGTLGPKIGSINCNGLGNRLKRDSVLHWLDSKPEEIFMLQETHTTQGTENEWRRAWDGKIYFNHGTSNSTGTSILIKRRAAHIKVVNHVILIPGRVHYLEIDIDSVSYCIVNVYAPNNDDLPMFESIFTNVLGRSRNDFLIMCGDWNTVLDNNVDKQGGSSVHSNNKTQTFLNNMISDYGICDVFRVTRGTEKLYTHFNKKCKTATRLDFFLIDDALVNFPLCKTSITHGFMSDHSYISLDIQGSRIIPGKGYWKLNNSHLHDQEFINGVKDIIAVTSNESYDSYRGLFDVIKFKVKDFAIRYGAKKKRNRGRERDILQKEIEKLKKDNDLMKKDNLRDRMFQAEAELNEIISADIKGSMTRSRARWVEEGERSTKYFFGLEKTNGKKKFIGKLSSDSGSTIYDQEGISRHVVEFYQNLFKSRNPSSDSIKSYIDSVGLPTISQDIYNDLERPFSASELDIIVTKLKNNKSPGWDGLSGEFYKEFWPQIRDILFNALQESITASCLSPSQRIGILTLIPKPKTPTELAYIKNWRPITLLNIDYKLFTHVIKNRLRKAVPTIISKMQSGFQPGKSTSDNLILMCMALEHFYNNDEEEGVILQVDLQKAFDSVEHSFLFETMRGMGFGDYMIHLVKTAFSGCMSLANVNGHLSSPIYLLRGLHQGSPLSPLLFLLVAQVLTSKIIGNPRIEGLNISGENNIMSLFADDTDLFLKASLPCIAALFNELDTFGLYSGCKANVSKTRCIPLGKTRSDTSFLDNLKITYGDDFLSDDFTALGIDFSNSISLDQITTMNYEKKIKIAMGWIDSWKMRDLSIYGRITIIKSLIMSQFSYLVIPLPRPAISITKRINTLTFNFLWGCKRDKIKREQIVRPVSMGGLDMFYSEDFILSLKISLLSKVIDPRFDHSWKRILYKQLRYQDHPTISIENGLVKMTSFKYTSDLLNTYQDWKNRTSEARGVSINHCVWGNPKITDVGAKLWEDCLIRKGVYYLDQFLTENRSIYSYNDLLARWDLNPSDLSKNRYVNIKMAIRRYDCPSVPSKSIYCLHADVNLSPFKKTIRAKSVRMTLIREFDIDTLTPLRDWKTLVKRDKIDWDIILHNIRFTVSNNYKLIQFQYKLLMRISTCKLMRWRMHIEKENGNCVYCNVPETLSHIFFNCDYATTFITQLIMFITNEIDLDYRDGNRFFFLTCSHENNIVNFVNLAAKWYISRQFQTRKVLLWGGFLKHLKIFMLGEKVEITRGLEPILSAIIALRLCA